DINETGENEGGDADEEEVEAQEAENGPISNNTGKIEERETEEKNVSIAERINEVEENGEGEGNADDGIECACAKAQTETPQTRFCDGCDLIVHSTCYGSPLVKGIPEVAGGARKPTNDGRWAHIVCAVYVSEAFFTDPEGREGIDFSRVPDKRKSSMLSTEKGGTRGLLLLGFARNTLSCGRSNKKQESSGLWLGDEHKK
ncbi:hypothetical protein C3L33_10091, partial [Rhododendron williamsianum]